MAGLGAKRKSQLLDAKANADGGSGGGGVTAGMASKKAKTLSEKRVALQADIMKFGLAAVEKLYPRQGSYQQHRQQHQQQHSGGAMRRTLGGKHASPIKMKPRPSGDFEEIDARRILRPLSHDKYIHEPHSDSVVYIARRNGLVPLSSLCKDSKTVMSSNVRLLQGRNVRLGKPEYYLRDKGRMLGLGGSRDKVIF